MKKTLSVIAAGVLLAGSLAVFAGCAKEIKDEARAAEIFAAVAGAEITQYSVASSSQADYLKTDGSTTLKSTNKQKITMQAYEESGFLFADVFQDGYSYAEQKGDGKTASETRETYSMDFVRAGDTYSATGAWSDVDAKKGNFTALLQELKANGAMLSGSDDAQSDYVDLNEADMQSFGALAPLIGGKAYKKGSGYLVKLDLVECRKNVLLGYQAALTEYASKPDMTVSEFLDNDFLAKYLAAELMGQSAEDVVSELKTALRERSISLDDGDFPACPADMGGAEYFMLCLDDEGLFAAIMSKLTGEEWTEGGTLGGARMDTVFGRAGELLSEVLEMLEDVEGLFLKEMLNFAGGEEDSGKFSYTLSVSLDSKLNVTAATLAMKFSMTEYRNDTKTTQSGNTRIEIKVLATAPVLSDLTRLKADMGYSFAVGEYEIPEGDDMLHDESYKYYYGKHRGTVTVTENKKLIVEITFEEKSGAFTFTDSREYDLRSGYISDMNDFFVGWEFPNGEKVSYYGGMDYFLSVRPSTGIFYLSMYGFYSDNLVPAPRIIRYL